MQEEFARDTLSTVEAEPEQWRMRARWNAEAVLLYGRMLKEQEDSSNQRIQDLENQVATLSSSFDAHRAEADRRAAELAAQLQDERNARVRVESALQHLRMIGGSFSDTITDVGGGLFTINIDILGDFRAALGSA